MTRARVTKQRADVTLVARGLAPTRARAHALILEGLVRSGERTIAKPGELVAADAPLHVETPEHSFVSRGGVKLSAALDAFAIEPTGLVCLDIGASTGGFTDCLLKRGATRVWAVDVGYGQIAWELRRDPRVRLLERTNIRDLARSAITDAIDLVVIDVSFISLRLVLPKAAEFLEPGARVIALVKPQFEVGREHVGRGGIVRDAQQRTHAVDEVVAAALRAKLMWLGTVPSPIQGRDGNQEYLIALVAAERA